MLFTHFDEVKAQTLLQLVEPRLFIEDEFEQTIKQLRSEQLSELDQLIKSSI